jgi:signal transduction histidine kinase
MPPRARVLRLAPALLVIGLGLASERALYDPALGLALTIADFAAGALLIGCGAVAWDRRAESRVGALMTLAGFTWFLGNLGGAAIYFHRGPLVQLVLSYPTGRLRGRLAYVVTAAAYADALIEPLAQSDGLTLALSAAIAGAAVDGFVGSTGPTRRARAVGLVAALSLSAGLALAAVDRLASLGHGVAVLWAYDAIVAAIPVMLLVDLLRGHWTDAAVRGLVVDLGAKSGTAGLQPELARALGDPSLVLGYRLPETGTFVDDAGRQIALPVAGSGRTATRLDEQGELIGVLVHDDALLADQQLIDAVAAVAQLAVANARLQAEARTQVEELERSRRRVVETTDRQRRRLEQELRSGPERLLDGARASLAEAAGAAAGPDGAVLATLAAELEDAGRELREFGQGIRPAALAEGGVTPALATLAEHSPLPATVEGTLGRLPEPVEAALYFVCSEGLANAVKHAHATRVSIRVGETGGRARVVVADDGVGGAAASPGSGLTGLTDRVEALGGTLRLESPAGSGTRLSAELPVR